MHVIPIPWRLGTPWKPTIGAANATAGPFTAGVEAIMVVATADCHIVIGVNPVATTAATLIRAGFPPLIFRVTAGESLGVIQDSTGGTLYVTELTH